jgi:hypothetical protein
MTICGWHGGQAPQVKAAATVRLQALTDAAIGVFEAFLGPPREGRLPLDDDLVFRCAKDVLDRTGFKEVSKLEISRGGNLDLLTDSELVVFSALQRKALGLGAGEEPM